MAQRLANPTRIHENAGLIYGLAQRLRIQCWHVARILHCCGCRLAAVASIQPLGWEFPYAMGVTLKKPKKKKKQKLKNGNLKKKGGRERTTAIPMFSILEKDKINKVEVFNITLQKY